MGSGKFREVSVAVSDHCADDIVSVCGKRVNEILPEEIAQR